MDPAAEKTMAIKELDIPKNVDDLLALIRRIVTLPAVKSVEVTPKKLVVKRLVVAEEEVVPTNFTDLPTVDADFLLKRTALETLAYEPEVHPFHRLAQAFAAITNQNMPVVAVLAPDPDTFGAFLGYDEGEELKHIFGVEVLYFGPETVYDDKFVVVGGRHGLREATTAVVVDL